jgi:hypothetical protein
MGDEELNTVKPSDNAIAQNLSILVLGAGIGWLSGLSISPVIEHVITALIGLAGGVVTGIYSVRSRVASSSEANTPSVSALPAALLVVGMAVGAPLGIMGRTHAIFGNAGQKDQVKQSAGKSSDNEGKAVLYDAHTTDCGEFMGVENQDAELRNAMKLSTQPWAKVLADSETDPTVVKAVMEAICETQP